MYGSVDGVAQLATMWTVNGEFTKNPVEATVEDWLTQVSNQFDICLANYGFTVPVTLAAAVSSIDLFVNGLVADLVHSANSSGRYSQKKIQTGNSVLSVVLEDIEAWCKANALALEILGVPRVQTAGSPNIFYTYRPERQRDLLDE